VRYLFYAVAAYFAYRALMYALAWKSQQNGLDRAAAQQVADTQKAGQRYAMIGGIVSGVGGVVGSLVGGIARMK
jgi:hypothetical protein